MKRVFFILLLLLFSCTVPAYSAEMELVDEGILVHGNCFEYICNTNTDDYSVEIMDGFPALFHTRDGIKYTFAVLAAEDQMIGDLQEYSVERTGDFFGVSFSEGDILDILPESFDSFENWTGIRTDLWHKIPSDQVISASVYAMTDSTHTLVVMLSREGKRKKVREAGGKKGNDAYFKDFPLHPTRSAQSDQLGQYAYEKGDALYNENSYEKAMEWFLVAAKMEWASAKNTIGVMYENGYGVGKDYSEALNWYRKAAAQENAEGQKNLGWMYYNGFGVDINYTEAVKWYRKAADQGNAIAQNNLGWMYQNGYGINQNYREAVSWYRKAADQGDAAAQKNLGTMYYSGYGVTKDFSEAVKWYRKGADQGNIGCQKNLGWMYQNGNGVEKNYTEAVKWYRKAADQGDATCQYRLGVMYENGYGVGKNIEEAKKWYHLAAAQGDGVAKGALSRIE